MADALISACFAAYLAGGFAVLGWMAFRDIEQMREAFFIVLLWPLFLLLMPVIVLNDWLRPRGWCVDIQHQPDRSPFGFRRRPTGTGWAVRCLWLELQVWQFRDEPRQ